MAPRDVLSAIPVAASDTSFEVLPGGGAVLTRRVLEADAGHVRAWLGRTLGFQRPRRFELDEVGACFWRQVDGVRHLSDIHATLCSRFGLSPEQGRRAIVEFTAVLLHRNLLALRLEGT